MVRDHDGMIKVEDARGVVRDHDGMIKVRMLEW